MKNKNSLPRNPAAVSGTSWIVTHGFSQAARGGIEDIHGQCGSKKQPNGTQLQNALQDFAGMPVTPIRSTEGIRGGVDVALNEHQMC